MLKSFRVSCAIPNSVMNKVSVLGNDYAASRVFPKVVDRVVETLEKSKMIKRVRARVYRTEDGYAITSNVRTKYPEDVITALYDECVFTALSKEIEVMIG